MKVQLNLFREFYKIELRDSCFCPNDDAVGLDAADYGVFIFFAIHRFEVVGQCD